MILRPRILFIANAGPAVGGGHVMRSLSLAGALQQHGAECVFLVSPDVAAMLDAFAPDMAREPATSLAPTAIVQAATEIAFDAVVFDHYGLARDEHQAIAQGRPALVIDDLADRPLAADVVLDSGPARTEADYAGLAEGARLLLGPRYAPLRPQFAALRDDAIARRGGPVERVLIAMGMTDVGGVTVRVVDRLRQRIGQVALDVVLGAGAPSLPSLRRVAAHDARLHLHVDAQDMAELTLQADIAIGAGGSTSWERCTLGLPCLTIVLAENQRAAAQALAQQSATLTIDAAAGDFDSSFDRAAVRLMSDPATRARLTAASLEVCDGLGAPRVAEAFLEAIAKRA